MSVAALIKAKEAKAAAPAAAAAPAPKAVAAPAAAAPAKAAAPALPAAPRASVEAKAAPAAAAAGGGAKAASLASPPGGAAVTTRPRGNSGAGSLTAPLPSGAAALNANAMADGLTFVEKDAVASVQAVVDAVTSKSVDQKTFRGVLGYVLKHIENGELPAEVKAKLLSDNAVHALFTGLYDVLGCAVRSKVKDKELSADLARIGMPKLFADDLLSAVSVKRDTLQAAALAKRIALPSVVDVQWRVDVTVSTTTLSRVFKPTLIVQLTLSDGVIKAFECSVDKFHELRYNIAKLLKAMQDVEQHPTLLRVE